MLSVLGTVLSINAFSVANSMSVLERDFKYGPYNKWDASMTYPWRLIPYVYIPVDYFYINRELKEGKPRQLYQHPVFTWDESDEESENYRGNKF